MTQQMIDRAAHNVALMEAGYAAFGRGDMIANEALFDPDIVGTRSGSAASAATIEAGRRC